MAQSEQYILKQPSLVGKLATFSMGSYNFWSLSILVFTICIFIDAKLKKSKKKSKHENICSSFATASQAICFLAAPELLMKTNPLKNTT